MNKQFVKLSLILGVVSILGTACKNEIKMEAPVAKKVAHELKIHDDTRVDNYYWLRIVKILL